MTRTRTVLFTTLAPLALAAAAQGQCFEQQLNAFDADNIDVYGWGMDLDGDLLAIGSIGDDEACLLDPNCNSGSVYLYRRAGGSFTFEAKLNNSDAVQGDEFGNDVAVSGDRVLIGSHMKDEGAAYVFSFDGLSWTQEQKLAGSGLLDNHHFGHSVSLDGDVALIGAMRDDHQGFETGSAFIFERAGGTWVERAKLIASDAASGARYGRSCDIEGDYAAVGAHLHDGPAGTTSGGAYVYERDDNGTPADPSDDTWPEVAALVPSDAEAGILFGRSVDFTNNILIVGCERGKSGGLQTGAAYLFFRDGSGWNEVQKLVPDDGADGDRFGVSVAIDGIYALVGSRSHDNQAGAVYVYTRTPSGYIQTGKIQGPDTVAGDRLGDETGVQVQGTTMIATSRFSSAAATTSGTAYVFTLDDCLGVNYCDVSPNSAGAGAEIRAAGIQSISDNDFTLISTGAVPNTVGLFFYGPNQINIPFGNGRLCIDGVVRLNPPIVTDGAGVASRQVDFTVFPAGSGANQINAGSTWNFQHWFRDVPAGGAEFNTSNALEVTFIP